MFDKNYFQQRYDTTVMGVDADRRRAYLYRARLRTLDHLGIHPETVVELASGAGSMTRWLVDSYPRVIATDVADAALQSCRARMPKDAVELVRTDAAHVALRDGFADMVVAFDLVEHLPEPERCLAEVHRLLRPGGIFFLSTPNPASLGARIKGRYPEYRSLPLAKRKKQWFGWQDDSHVSILAIEAWREMLTEAGFEIVADGSDYWWDAPYVTWLPAFPQEAVCKVLQRVFTRLRYFIPWKSGENYIAIVRKVVG